MSTLLQTILEIIWLLLPAGAANMMPVIAARYNLVSPLAVPLDRGATFRGRRLLGDNKTLRGLIVGIFFGSATAYIQHLAVPQQSAAFALLFGAAIGAGALAGDAVKSFFKRQLGVAPGQPWRPWDQIDFVIGALAAALLFIPLSLASVVVAIIFFGLLSFVTSAAGTALKIKKTI